MDHTRLVRVGAVLLAASFVVTLVLAGLPATSPDGLGERVVASWLASACLQVGALMLVAGLVLRGLRPSQPAPPTIEHAS